MYLPLIRVYKNNLEYAAENKSNQKKIFFIEFPTIRFREKNTIFIIFIIMIGTLLLSFSLFMFFLQHKMHKTSSLKKQYFICK